MIKTLAILAMTMSPNTASIYTDYYTYDSDSTCFLNTTVLRSTIEEMEMITDFIAEAKYITRLQNGDERLVLFFNDTKDTLLVRHANSGSDEFYRMFAAPIE